MLAMGSEIGHSQQGNNNAYAQDNAISWLDWRHADLSLAAFVQKLIAIRQAHAALSADAFLTGGPFDASGLRDVEWRHAEGELVSPQQWEEAEASILVVVLAGPTDAAADRVAIVLNRGHVGTQIQLPEARAQMSWRVLIDAGAGEAADSAERDVGNDDRLTAPPRSTLIVAEVAAPHRPAPLVKADDQLIDTLARSAGIAADWWDVGGAHTIVARETKIALLGAMRLPAASRVEALESLRGVVDEREARVLPHSIVARLGAPLVAPLRSEAAAPVRAVDLLIETEDGRMSFSNRSSRFSVTARSERISSISTFSISRLGSTEPPSRGTASSSNARTTCTRASSSRRACDCTPVRASSMTLPGMSMYSMVACTVFCGLNISASRSSRTSGTRTTPTWASCLPEPMPLPCA